MRTRTGTKGVTMVQKAARDQAVVEQYAKAGYVRDDGGKDSVKARQAIFEAVRTAKVQSLGEIKTKAITKEDVTARVFPESIPPENFDQADDPELAEAVWNQLVTEVWGALSYTANSQMQQLVGGTMGNGYVLCRCEIQRNRVKRQAVYITDDEACINRDIRDKELAALQRKHNSVAALAELLISRQPNNATHWQDSYSKRIKAISAITQQRLQLALESAAPADSAGPAEEDEN